MCSILCGSENNVLDIVRRMQVTVTRVRFLDWLKLWVGEPDEFLPHLMIILKCMMMMMTRWAMSIITMMMVMVQMMMMTSTSQTRLYDQFFWGDSIIKTLLMITMTIMAMMTMMMATREYKKNNLLLYVTCDVLIWPLIIFAWYCKVWQIVWTLIQVSEETAEKRPGCSGYSSGHQGLQMPMMKITMNLVDTSSFSLETHGCQKTWQTCMDLLLVLPI